MTAVYIFSEARQRLASLLDQAASEGEIRIERRDGRVFVVRPLIENTSPLNVAPVDLNLTTDEIVQIIRESRESYAVGDMDNTDRTEELGD